MTQRIVNFASTIETARAVLWGDKVRYLPLVFHILFYGSLIFFPHIVFYACLIFYSMLFHIAFYACLIFYSMLFHVVFYACLIFYSMLLSYCILCFFHILFYASFILYSMLLSYCILYLINPQRLECVEFKVRCLWLCASKGEEVWRLIGADRNK